MGTGSPCCPNMADGDPLVAAVLVEAVVLDRGGSHDGETKLHFQIRVLGT